MLIEAARPENAHMNIYFQKTHQRAYGTFPLNGDTLHSAIRTAVEIGYRAFDTAQMYQNERDVGEALRATGLAMSEFCLTTKVHPDNFGEGDFIRSVEMSLSDLGVSQVDVLLVHWPPVGGDIVPSLKRLEDAHRRGLAANIGVSNYTSAMMRLARDVVEAPLVTNQVEFHPLLNQETLLAASAETGIPLSAYCAVARGEILNHPIFAEIGSAYGKSPIQVALRWSLQKGVSLNMNSTKPDNIRANFEIMDFTLSSVDMARISAVTKTDYRIVTAEKAPWAPRFD